MSDLKPPFGGKFRLVPLFNGTKPEIRNGHSYYAYGARACFTLADKNTVTIFAGQRTDLASIPSVVWGLLPPDGEYALAAAFHDEGYRSKGSYDGFHPHEIGRTRPAPYTRAEVDDILLQGMVALGVAPWKRAVIYRAVRLFGGAGWGT